MELDELGRAGVEHMIDHMRESLRRFRVRVRRLDLRGLAPPGRSGARPRAPGRARADVPLRGRALGAHLPARRRQGPRDRALLGRAHLLRLRHRLPPEQARAGLRPADRRLGRRPPRLRAPDEGGLRGAGRRPGPARARDHAVRPPGRARRPGAAVEAGGHDRHPRRAGRRHRHRRRALVPPLAQPRHDDRPGPRPGAQPVAGQPRLLRAVRARPDRVDPAQGGGGAGGGRAAAPTSARAPSASIPRRARSSSGCSSSPARWRRPPRAARRTG